MELRASPHPALAGAIRLPGDKSISHRALMLASLAVGPSRIEGLLEGEDVLCTAEVLQAMGVEMTRGADGIWSVHGVGVAGLAEPDRVLDFGNAGTGARLFLGILAGHGFTSFLTGDGSLRARPMARVVQPLERMGAAVTARSLCRLPLAITGRDELLPITWTSPVASAQVKSAVLLAGLHASGTTTVIEPLPSRDHTERMLSGMGATVTVEALAGGSQAVAIQGQPELAARSFLVPGDPSSAAFPLVAAIIAPDSRVLIEDVGLNPLRTGLLTTLLEMGGRITIQNRREVAGELVGDLLVETSALSGVEVPPERAPTMIDEYPVLAVAAAFARGRTVMRGLAELRVKESDRLMAVAHGLEAAGVRVAIEGDDLIVEGGPAPAGGVVVDAGLDHRIGMSFLILGGLAAAPVTVAGAETIETSFPGFPELMNGLGARITAPAEPPAAATGA